VVKGPLCGRVMSGPAVENLFLPRKSGLYARFFFYQWCMMKTADAYHDRIARAVSELIGPVVADLGYELVEVQFRRESHGLVLRVIIFHEQGIGVDDCSLVSREVSRLLDVEDQIDQAYHLEVSSPGLDRPLQTARDFARYTGKTVRVIFGEASEEVVGAIEEVDENQVVLSGRDGRREVPLSQVKKARLVIEF